MSREELLRGIDSVKLIASVTKLKRFLMCPTRYVRAILFREIIYKRSRKEKEVICNTFFGTSMRIYLPSSTDIYLTGGKSHDSELRLARFLICRLTTGQNFLDVGAHYGYFTLLASKLVGPNGRVFSFEASPTSYAMLQKNVAMVENISSYHRVVSRQEGNLTFYEFPNKYSEFNTVDIDQYKNEAWFAENQPRKITVESIILDDFFDTEKERPEIIKIDVEGAEYDVILGMKEYLRKNAPIIVMEYLSNDRGNKQHIKAEKLLRSYGYSASVIDQNGELVQLQSVPSYLDSNSLESDNIVFEVM